MTNFHGITPDSSMPIHPTDKKKAEKAKTFPREGKISAEEMAKSVQQGKAIKTKGAPLKSSAPAPSLKTDTFVKSIKKERPPPSPARQIAGQPIYHLKRDMIPWMENMFKSGSLANMYTFEKFKEFVESRKDLTPTQKDTLVEIASKELASSSEALVNEQARTLALPELAEDLDSVLLPEKEEVNRYKGLSKSIEKSVHEGIQNYSVKIKESCLKECPDLPPEVTKGIEDFQQNIFKNARSIEGLKRFEVIHEDPFWDPETVTKRYMALTTENEALLATSAFQAVGPAYSSQAPRNRTEEESCPPNFFRSTLSIKDTNAAESEQEQLLLDVTRSAITVEFDQKDPETRSIASQRNLEQVVDQQVTHLVKQLSERDPERLEAATNPETPLTLKGQTVNLLTPDILRSLTREHPTLKKIGVKVSHGLSGAPADDERALALENLEAHQHLNNQLVQYTIKSAEGDKTIFVKYDLRYFNIPNNIMYAKLPKALTDSKELTSSNNESWKKLEQDVASQIAVFTSKIAAASKEVTSRKEREALNDMYRNLNACNRLRENIMLSTIESGEFDKKRFEVWQKLADTLSDQVKELEKDPSLSQEFKEALSLIKKRTQLLDLYMDTRELFLSGLSKNLVNMDNNRSALATRIILLGSMIDDNQVHFGCRSGKDRTGLVDIELKLLASEAVLNGRLPSYREQERLPDNTNLREVITMGSGNVFDFVRANLGANLGINTGGAASDPLEQDEAGQQLEELTDRAQASSKMASRPSTNFIVPSGHQEYWNQQEKKTIIL